MPAVAKQKAPTKRIVNVTITRATDTDPDTSWLGEYSNHATSDEYSIDRAHSEDCASANDAAREAHRMLESAAQHIARQRTAEGNNPESIFWEPLDETADTLSELAEDVITCDCGERGDMGRGEYQYFNPSFNYVGKDGKPTDGLTPADVAKYTRQDYDRMESLNAGNWGFIGITARAEVVIGDTVQRITSGGLWGIESDAGSYLKEVEAEELAGLREVLKGMGFTSRAISTAFKNVETSDE